MPFGVPVVPEVKAMNATSSAAVSTAAKPRRLGGGAPFDPVGGVGREVRHRRQRRAGGAREVEFRGEPRIAQRVRDPRLGDDVDQLPRAQQRHRRDGDRAGLHHREPARGHRRRVRPAQQHAVAGNDAEVVDQHARDPARPGVEFGVGPAHALRREHREALAAALAHRALEQLGRDVEPLGVPEPGRSNMQLRPLVARRQVVAREAVDVRTGRHVRPSLMTSRPMISCCTSVAPS